jgi:small-conductance mechanosensitive channel
LRSDSGEQIVLSNADILKSRVRNYGRAEELRVLTTLRVSYDTEAEKLRSVPPMMKDIVTAQPNTRFDRCHLLTLGDSSLQFELSYFVQQPNVNSVADIQQAINLGIIDGFRAAQIGFESPSQRVFIARTPARAGAQSAQSS